MTSPARAAQSKPSVVESLKRERDRFVALAFCAADVLIEADADCGITYAAGATVGVTGYPADQLVGDSLLKIVTPDDRLILRELIRGMTVGKRLQPISIRLIGPKGLTPKLLLTGYVLPNLPGSLFFALRPWTEGNGSDDKNPKGRDKESGLYKTDAFLAQVEKRIESAKSQSESIEFTMLRLENFVDLGKELDAKAAAENHRRLPQGQLRPERHRRPVRQRELWPRPRRGSRYRGSEGPNRRPFEGGRQGWTGRGRRHRNRGRRCREYWRR